MAGEVRPSGEGGYQIGTLQTRFRRGLKPVARKA